MLMHAGDTMMPERGKGNGVAIAFLGFSLGGGQGGEKCTIGLKVTYKQKGSALP